MFPGNTLIPIASVDDYVASRLLTRKSAPRQEVVVEGWKGGVDDGGGSKLEGWVGRKGEGVANRVRLLFSPQG